MVIKTLYAYTTRWNLMIMDNQNTNKEVWQLENTTYISTAPFYPNYYIYRNPRRTRKEQGTARVTLEAKYLRSWLIVSTKSNDQYILHSVHKLTQEFNKNPSKAFLEKIHWLLRKDIWRKNNDNGNGNGNSYLCIKEYKLRFVHQDTTNLINNWKQLIVNLLRVKLDVDHSKSDLLILDFHMEMKHLCWHRVFIFI